MASKEEKINRRVIVHLRCCEAASTRSRKILKFLLLLPRERVAKKWKMRENNWSELISFWLRGGVGAPVRFNEVIKRWTNWISALLSNGSCNRDCNMVVKTR